METEQQTQSPPSPRQWVKANDERLRRLAWVEAGSLLWLDFGTNMFCFFGVPEIAYKNLVRTKNKRKYLRDHVIGRFEFERHGDK